ncbi:MAG: hypothetical protein Q7V04_00140, partial [Deltaproteobacteria bacterium]|nr:hypothetical protein [Deltaproteobacteria bacterium]
VPARWLFRNGNSAYATNVSESSHVDASSNYGFLQRPGHQADIWYIGINTPNQAMGAFQLTTREIPAPLKQVNSSSTAVSGQIANTWQWFKFTVPSSTDPNNASYEPNFLGWDLRLKASLGNPRMVIRRDQLPADFNTNTGYYSYYLEQMSSWQTGLQWAPGIGDAAPNWTYGGGPTGRYNGDKNSYLIAGLGSPLEAGSYYVGVSGDGSDTAPLSYTLESRGIGIGNDTSSVPWPIQVVDLGNFTGGSVNKTGLAPREAAYYRITVPAAQKSWSVKLEPTLGEALMSVRQGALPNMTAQDQPSDSIYYFAGNRRQKAGREFFHKYAESPQTAITAGTYYIAVFSEGQNPPDNYIIGSGNVNFTLTSYGPMPVADKTSTPAAVGTPVTWNGETLQYGQQKVYRFRVPAGLTSMEIRLKNRVGNPTMALRQDAAGSGMIPGKNGLDYIAHEGGYDSQWSNDTLITVPQPVAGDYSLVVAAASLNSGPPSYTISYPDASCDVEVTAQGLVVLPFTNGNIPVSGQEANTWRFFQVSVPSGALGWDLRLKASLGNPRMVIRRDQLPADFYSATGYFTYGLERLSSWQTGLQWAPGIGDMYYNAGYGQGGPTRRYSSDRNSYLIAGMGSPLEAGSYYVGVSGDGSDTAPLSYTLESRGIGIGNDTSSVPWPIQVVDLGNFTGGSVSKTGLAPREAAYYRITVPAAQKSWSVKLEPTLGEALMSVR